MPTAGARLLWRQKVKLYQVTTLPSAATSSPYSYMWIGTLNGTYALTAKAYDNSGALTTSTAVTVTIN